jgi:hypothetical protein
MIKKRIHTNLNNIFASICIFFKAFVILKLKKTSLLDMILFKRNFWTRGWSVVGIYSRKVEGSSFPMVVVLGRTALGAVRNDHLKMGIF